MAAEDVKGKKRKGATETAPQAKKARKSDDVAAAAKPTKASKPAKSKPARKEAADLFDKEEVVTEEPAKPTRSKKTKAPVETNGDAMDIEATEATEKPKRQPKKSKTTAAETVPEPVDVKVAKKGKKGKQADPAPVEQDESAEVEEAAVSKSKAKKGKASKKVEAKEEIAVVPEETEDDVAEDDQTAALLAGFESDDDSDDPEEDLDFDDDVHVPALNAKQRKAIEKAEKAAQSDKPGVIYVGRVPRGFFEPQMKKYFSQFGRVNRLRLSRNKKTGASKHYAFVEFASTEVADIVARTMNNYLLFGHILKCKLIPEDQVHVNLFKGAGQRFKVDPRNKKAGLDMERGVERSRWEKRVNEENKRRSGRSKALKEQFGYEYNAPEVRSVDDVPKQSALKAAEPQQQLEDAPAEEPKGKKGKKAAKSKAVAETTVDAPEPVPEPAAPVAEKKGKKDKKRKSDVAALENTAVTEETVGEDAAAAPAEVTAPKSKKAKKDTKSAAPAPAAEAEEKPKRKAKAAAVEQAPAAAAAPKAKKAKKAKA